MKKILPLIIISILFIFVGCKNNEVSKVSISEEFTKSLGYEIVSSDGEVETYKLDESNLYENDKSIQRQQAWALQEVDFKQYMNSQITIHKFTVKNHPLESIYNVNTNLYIMLVDNTVIGGYSAPNIENNEEYYSLSGSSFEKITGLTFDDWKKNLNK